MSTWTTAEAQQIQRGGYEDGLTDGARGRGSRARYRRAVVAAIGRWTYYRREASDRAAAYRRSAVGDGRAIAETMIRQAQETERRAHRLDQAIARARRILRALDGVRS